MNLFGLGPETILDFVLIDHRNSGSKPEKNFTTLKNSKVAPEKLDMCQGTDWFLKIAYCSKTDWTT